MLPYIGIFGVSIPTYGLISVLGVFAAGLVSLSVVKKRSIDIYGFLSTAIAAAAGLFVGAHLLYSLTRIEDIAYVLSHYDHYDGFWDFAQKLLRPMSGMVFYGGLYGGLLAGFIFAIAKRYPVGEMGDVFAVFIPLFHAFGRVGCFFAGCCYGVESEFGIAGRVYAVGMRESTKRFPVQLLEALCLLLLFAVMLSLCKREKARGKLIFIYLISYAVLRFILEFFRGDEIRGRLLMFSTSQWISILTIIWVSLYLVIEHIKLRKTE